MICVSEFELGLILDIVKNHASNCDVLAFGSRYKRTPKDYSDLNLAFALTNGQKLGIKRTGQLEEEFSKSELPYRVDVVDYNTVSPEFRAIIDRGEDLERLVIKSRIEEGSDAFR